MPRELRSFADRMMDEERHRQRLLDYAFGTIPRHDAHSNALERAVFGLGGSAELARQLGKDQSSLDSRSRMELSGLVAGAQAEAELQKVVGYKFGNALSDFAREYGKLGSQMADVFGSMSRVSAFDIDHLGRMGRGLQDAVAPLEAVAADLRRALGTATWPPPDLMPAERWREISRSLREVTKPLGEILEGFQPDWQGRQHKAWLREIQADRTFWEEANEEIAALAEVDETLPSRLTDFIQRIGSRLWLSTRQDARNISLFVIFSLLMDLIALAAVLGVIASPSPQAQQTEGARRLAEATRELNEAISQITQWIEQRERQDLRDLPRANVRSAVWVRDGPGTKFGKIAQLAPGTVVAIQTSRANWFQIVFEDPLTDDLRVGWVAARLLNVWAQPRAS